MKNDFNGYSTINSYEADTQSDFTKTKNPEQLDLFNYRPIEKEDYGIPNDWIREQAAGDGCKCFACGRWTKIYHRTITSSMARALILIHKYYFKYDHNVLKSMHIEGFLKRCRTSSATRGDVAKLRFWGLIRKNENKSGHYYYTAEGARFVKNELMVPRYAVVYDNHFFGLEGESFMIVEAFKNYFDYEELMSSKIEYLGK